MNRRTFLKTTGVASVALPALAPAADLAPVKSVNRTSTAIAAYYLNAHMYTYVPRHVRADLEWMAGVGTN